MNLPWRDWQFWVATALALSALLFVARPFLMRRRKAGACPNCPSGSAAARARPKQAPLTVEGKCLTR